MGNAGDVRLDVVALARDEMTAAVNRVNGELDAMKAKLAGYEKSQRATAAAANDNAAAAANVADKVKDLAKAGDEALGPFNKVKELASKVASNWLFVKDAVGGVIDVLKDVNELRFNSVMRELRALDKTVDSLAGTFVKASLAAEDMRKKVGGAQLAALQADLRKAQIEGDIVGAGQIAGQIAGLRGGAEAQGYRDEAKKARADAAASESKRLAATSQLAKVSKRADEIQRMLDAGYGLQQAVGGGGGPTREQLQRELNGTAEVPGLNAQRMRLIQEALPTGLAERAAEYAKQLDLAADATERATKAEELNALIEAGRASTAAELVKLKREAASVNDGFGGGGGGGGGGGQRSKSDAEEMKKRMVEAQRAQLDELAALEHQNTVGAWEEKRKLALAEQAEERARVDQRLAWIHEQKAAEEERLASIAAWEKELADERKAYDEAGQKEFEGMIGSFTDAINTFGDAVDAKIPGAKQAFADIAKVWQGIDKSSKGLASGVIGSIDAILSSGAEWFKSEKEKTLFLAGKEAALAVAMAFINPAEAASHGVASAMLFALAGAGGGGSRGAGGGASKAPRGEQSRDTGGGGTTILNFNQLITDKQTIQYAVDEAARGGRGSGYSRRSGV